MSEHILTQAQLSQMPADFVEPLKQSLAAFPVATNQPAGMQTLHVNLQPTYPTVLQDVVYATKDDFALHLNIIEPANANGDRCFPLIMWVQGSGFQKQRLGIHLAHMIELARAGYVVAMVEYRYAPKWAFPVQVRDLNSATRFMLRHADQYHVDPHHYGAWGESSGAHTVVLASVTTNEQFFSDEPIDQSPLKYQACIDFYGPTDISRMNKVPSTQDHVTAHSFEGQFLGGKAVYDHPKLVQQANPIHYLSDNAPVPPFLIMHGDKDRIVPFEQSCLLYSALQKHQLPASFYRIAGSDHATDAFFTPATWQIVKQFLQAHL